MVAELRAVIADLRQFAKANVSIGKLYGLFAKFIDLCAPLIKPNPLPGASEQSRTPLHDDNSASRRVSGQMNFSHPDMLRHTSGQVLDPLPCPYPSNEASGVSSIGGWDDILMWELFDNQPSLGWTESELWDAMTQLNAT